MGKKLSKGEKEDEEEEDSTEKTTFEKFYEEFKQFLLVGCFEDDANRSKLAKLLRFVSSYTEKQDGKKKTSLEEYVARMQEEQPAIYYMTGEKISEMEREAALEVYKSKDLEVLYLDEPYAELCFSKIFDFEGVKMRSVQKAGDLRINWKTEETDRYNDLKKMYKPLTKWWEKNAGKGRPDQQGRGEPPPRGLPGGGPRHGVRHVRTPGAHQQGPGPGPDVFLGAAEGAGDQRQPPDDLRHAPEGPGGRERREPLGHGQPGGPDRGPRVELRP